MCRNTLSPQNNRHAYHSLALCIMITARCSEDRSVHSSVHEKGYTQTTAWPRDGHLWLLTQRNPLWKCFFTASLFSLLSPSPELVSQSARWMKKDIDCRNRCISCCVLHLFVFYWWVRFLSFCSLTAIACLFIKGLLTSTPTAQGHLRAFIHRKTCSSKWRGNGTTAQLSKTCFQLVEIRRYKLRTTSQGRREYVYCRLFTPPLCVSDHPQSVAHSLPPRPQRLQPLFKQGWAWVVRGLQRRM